MVENTRTRDVQVIGPHATISEESTSCHLKISWMFVIQTKKALMLTLPETNSSHLKMVVSNRNLLFQQSIFRGELLVSGRVGGFAHVILIQNFLRKVCLFEVCNTKKLA